MSVPNSRNSSLATVCRKGGVVVGSDVDVCGKVEGLMVQCLRGTSFGENLGQLAVVKTILKKSPAYQAIRHPDLNGSGRPGGRGLFEHGINLFATKNNPIMTILQGSGMPDPCKPAYPIQDQN